MDNMRTKKQLGLLILFFTYLSLITLYIVFKNCSNKEYFCLVVLSIPCLFWVSKVVSWCGYQIFINHTWYLFLKN